MPERCAALPASLSRVLGGVDLLLHAGDLGELWVLDRLSEIAPVIAVHGNDETAEAQRELPYQQIIALAGCRVLLTHSHSLDREEEMAFRRVDSWEPKRARWAQMGRRAGVAVVVFGHTHIPMVDHHDGVLLVNPGAIASAGWVARQRVQTIGLLFFRDDGTPRVTHVDLAAPERSFAPVIDWQAGFAAAHRQFSESLLTPDLATAWEAIRERLPLAPEGIKAAILRVAHRCWAGEQEAIRREDLLTSFRAETSIPAPVRAELERAILTG
jgi:putative phosphoesterase